MNIYKIEIYSMCNLLRLCRDYTSHYQESKNLTIPASEIQMILRGQYMIKLETKQCDEYYLNKFGAWNCLIECGGSIKNLIFVYNYKYTLYTSYSNVVDSVGDMS
jgi:hypothetical protein